MTLKRIEAHTDRELNQAIEIAIKKVGHTEFFTLLHGIDAYMERRKRRDARRSSKSTEAVVNELMADEVWGDS